MMCDDYPSKRHATPIGPRIPAPPNDILRRTTALDESARRYGIVVTMPPGDPMSAPHLLGAEWSGTRWYESAEARDAALVEMRRHPRYYRIGDVPSIELTPIER